MTRNFLPPDRYNLIDAFGADSRVFGYLKLGNTEGAKPNVTREMLEPALKELQFANVTYANDQWPPVINKFAHMNAPKDDWGSCKDPMNCKYTKRNVAQLISMRKCYAMIESYELATGTKFDLIARLRADDFWLYGIRPYCGFDNLTKSSLFTHGFVDTFFLLQRQFAHEVFTLSDTYYSTRGNVFTGTMGGVEGWIHHLALTSKSNAHVVNMSYPFPRALYRFNKAAVDSHQRPTNAHHFCAETHILEPLVDKQRCEKVMYNNT